MTSETIKVAFDAEFPGRHGGNRFYESLVDGLERSITRILCPAYEQPAAQGWENSVAKVFEQPAARPDSVGEGGKDRAGEMAEKMVVAAHDRGGIIFPPSRIAVYSDPVFDESRSATIRDLRAWLADALRDYGDETIEKTAQMLEVQGHNSSAGLVRVMKSSPAGATHG